MLNLRRDCKQQITGGLFSICIFNWIRSKIKYLMRDNVLIHGYHLINGRNTLSAKVCTVHVPFRWIYWCHSVSVFVHLFVLATYWLVVKVTIRSIWNKHLNTCTLWPVTSSVFDLYDKIFHPFPSSTLSFCHSTV